MSGFAWRELLGAAREVGVKPAEFWRMTPVELCLVLGREPGALPLTRLRLAELSAAFPDRRTDDGRDRDV